MSIVADGTLDADGDGLDGLLAPSIDDETIPGLNLPPRLGARDSIGTRKYGLRPVRTLLPLILAPTLLLLNLFLSMLLLLLRILLPLLLLLPLPVPVLGTLRDVLPDD